MRKSLERQLTEAQQEIARLEKELGKKSAWRPTRQPMIVQLDEATAEIRELKKKLPHGADEMTEAWASRLISDYEALGLTSQEAKIAVGVEAVVTKNRGLQDAFKLLGLNEAEAKLAAGRNL